MKGDWSSKNETVDYGGAFDRCEPSIAAFLEELGEVQK